MSRGEIVYRPGQSTVAPRLWDQYCTVPGVETPG